MNSSARYSIRCDAAPSNTETNKPNFKQLATSIRIFRTQKRRVASRMANEFHERLLHELAHRRVGGNHVDGAVDGIHAAELCHLNELADHALAPKARQSFVPDRCEQLLNARVRHELQREAHYGTVARHTSSIRDLFLLVSDGELESLEGLVFARLPDLEPWLVVVVQHDFQLMRGARVVQQRRRELLHVLPHFLHERRNDTLSPGNRFRSTETNAHDVLDSELALHAAQAPQLPRQLEGGQNGIVRAEGDERAGRKRAVGVDPRLRVAQRVRLARRYALIAPATSVVRHRQRRTPVQQDFQNFIVVPVSGEHQWRDVRRERRRRTVDGFPALSGDTNVNRFFVFTVTASA